MLLIRKRAEQQRAYANKQPLLISLLKETFLTDKIVSKMVIITKALAGWWLGKKRADHELKLKSFWDTLGRPGDPEEVKQCHGGHLCRLHRFSFIKGCPLVFPRSPGFPFIRLSLIYFFPCCPIIISNMFFQILFSFLLFLFHILSSCKYAFFVYWSL